MALDLARGRMQNTLTGEDGTRLKLVEKKTFIDLDYACAPPPLRRLRSEGDAHRAECLQDDEVAGIEHALISDGVVGGFGAEKNSPWGQEDLLSSTCSTSAAGDLESPRSCSPRSWSPSVPSEAATLETVPHHLPAHFQGLHAWAWLALIAGFATEEAPSHVEGALRERTTIFVANLPRDCTRDQLVQLLDYLGFWGRYTFVHVIADLATGLCKGQAFVDLQTHEDALLLQEQFEGVPGWERCRIGWATRVQGLRANIETYRNSDLMHHLVEDFYRPALYFYGQRVRFPRSTKKLRVPRLKSKFGGGAPARGFLSSPHVEDDEPRAVAPPSRSVAAARARGL